MKESITNSENVSKNEEVLKGISNFAKTIKVGSTSNIDGLEMNEENGEITPTSSSTFKVCTNTLPEKTSTWTKVKNVLCYRIEVKLTPYEQKIEDEINEFLHQEVTWAKVKDFLMQEVDITFRGKKIF